MNKNSTDPVELAVEQSLDSLEGIAFDIPLEEWTQAPMNIYLWTTGGVCVDEHLGAGNHASIIGIDIQNLFDLPNGREIQEGWDRAMEGEGSAFFTNHQTPPSLGGFIPVIPLPGMRSERVVGFCLPFGPRMFEAIKRFIKY